MNIRKRLLSFIICGAMAFSAGPLTAFAGDSVYTGGLCEHHTEHNEECGYIEAAEESPCTHEHTEECYRLVTDCVHEHTEECYLDGTLPAEGEEKTADACAHVCSEESGCVTKELDCEHEHSDECGYVPAKEGTPCTFVCEVCNPQDNGDTATPSDAQPEECTCETLCTEEEVNADCPVCSAEGAELDKVCVDAAPMLPVTALAADGIELYVGGQRITESGCYANQDGTWTKVEGTGPSSGQFYYDAATATLKLNGATIQGGTSTGSVPYGAGIYAQCKDSESVSLTIELIGNNTITGYYGIYVNAEISENSNGTDASLTITGENNVSLEVSGSFYGIFVKSGTGNASVTIENASVDAKTTQTNSGYAGVCVQSGASSKDSPNLSLAVNGGSLTTSGSASGDGIQFVVGSHGVTSATTSLSVTNNAIVDARNGGISASRTSVTLPTPTPTGNNSSGIVFDDKNGTVYGKVELQEDITIGEGESLTLDDGASLDAGNHNVIVDGGTLEESLAKSLGDSVKYAPTIVTPPADKSVTEGETATFTVNATGTEPLSYQWQQSTDNGKNWTNIASVNAAEYTTGKTTMDMSGTQYRCVVENSIDEVTSAAATLTVSPKQYTVTVQTDGNGTASASTTAAAAGTEITLTATPDSGYHFERWEVVSGTITIQNDKFIMPAENVTVKAVFDRNSSGGGGTYSLSEGIDRDEPKDEPEEEPEVEPDTPGTDIFTDFSDVPAEAWYSEAVDYFTENGIMSGVGGNRFEPETELKREMLAVILWNMMDNPEPNGIAPFLDVTSDKYYAKAIAWANENGVMYGYGEEFGVGEAVTREDFAAILYRYAAFKGYDTTQGGMAIREFIDFDQIADYAVEALGWAVNSGIISGMGDGTVSPKTSAYRGQAAVMLMKFCENVAA